MRTDFTWTEGTENRLLQIPRMVVQVDHTVGAGHPNPEPRRTAVTPGGGYEARPPVSVERLEFSVTTRQALGGTPYHQLDGLVASLRDVGYQPPKPVTEEPSWSVDVAWWETCSWLRAVYGVLLEEDRIRVEAVVDTVYARVARALRIYPPVVYTCPKCGADTSRVTGASVLECDACGFTHRITLESWQTMRPATAATLELLLGPAGVTVNRLREWKKQGRLKDYGKENGKNRYKPWEVLALLGLVD